MKWRDLVFISCVSLLVVGLVVFLGLMDAGRPKDSTLFTVAGADGVLWQVQTTFLSVGFAGLAIAAQLFAEAPLAIGASRSRVLERISAGWFVAIGLAANLIIAVEVLWFPTDGGAIVALVCTMLTVIALVRSTVTLVGLFGHPSRLDEVVKNSLITAFSVRLEESAEKYKVPREQILSFESADVTRWGSQSSAYALKVSVPEEGRILRSVRLKLVRQALTSLGPKAAQLTLTAPHAATSYIGPQISIDVEPGERTDVSQTAFHVFSSTEIDSISADRVSRLLQASLDFESVGSATPDEESTREIEHLQDAIGLNLRSGAFATAERALVLLGQVVRGVWTISPQHLPSNRRASMTRRDWLYRSIGEAELDAGISPRVASLFVSAAMTRAAAAPRTSSAEYVDECLRSLVRVWSLIIGLNDRRFDPVASSIVTSLQNLAAYVYPSLDAANDSWSSKAIWSIVELIKLAVEARSIELAKSAAQELDGLHQYDRDDRGRDHVRAGQLVLTAWLDLLEEKSDPRGLYSAGIRRFLYAKGTPAQIMSARSASESEGARSRWRWWEIEGSAGGRARVMKMHSYLDLAQVRSLVSAHGPFPSAENEQDASNYRRFLEILRASRDRRNGRADRLHDLLGSLIDQWESKEDRRLADEPISLDRVDQIKSALRTALSENGGIARALGKVDPGEGEVEDEYSILGMNFRVPRHFVVEERFNSTYADPGHLGQIIARGFVDGEDHKIVASLRSIDTREVPATAASVRAEIDHLGSVSSDFILITPFGGLNGVDLWYSQEFDALLRQVRHVETAALEDEAFLFHRDDALAFRRAPEEKLGLTPVEGTTISIGVFEDVETSDEPEVRIESGEMFSVWAKQATSVTRFVDRSSADDDLGPDRGDVDGEQL